MEKIVKLNRSLVEITGPDAQKLLHDTLTCNLSKQLGDTASWFALLAPQGKVLVEGLITSTKDGFLLDIPVSELENFSKRMRLYKMRANVTIEPREDLSAGWSASPVANSFQDKRANMGHRTYSASPEDWNDDTSTYHQNRITQSIMEMGADFETNSVFPHDIGMDQLEGVDFKKGCYIGQEVVSRMQHRGTARKRPVAITGVSLAVEQSIISDSKSIGTISSATGKTGLALVRLDKVNDPDACEVDGNAVQLAIPQWASYAF